MICLYKVLINESGLQIQAKKTSEPGWFQPNVFLFVFFCIFFLRL